MNVSIFASDISPHYEAVYKEYHKYFFSSTNKTQAILKLKECIIDIDEEKHISIREKAHAFSEHFSVQNMVDNLSNIYEGEINKTKK